MKKITFFILLLAFTASAFCQQTDTNTPLTREDYMKKSKNQKTTAWILAGGGAALIVTGAVMSGKEENSFSDASTETVLIGAGVLSAIGSIPFFIASAKNKKRAIAATAYFKMQDAPEIRKYCFTHSTFPAMALAVRF